MKTGLCALCFCVGLWSAAIHAQATLYQGRLAFYPLDGNANDVGGQARHALVSGASLAPDRFSQSWAYRFDGQDDFVRIEAADALFFGSGDFAISLWAQREQTAQYGVLLSGLSLYRFTLCCAHSAGYTLYSDADGGLHLLLMAGAYAFSGCLPGVCEYHLLNASLADGAWHHLVINVDRAAGGQFYLDGQLTARFDASHYQALAASTSAVVTLGNGNLEIPPDGFLQSVPWRGVLDEAQFFARALTSAEIQELAAATAPLPVIWQGAAATVSPALSIHLPYVLYDVDGSRVIPLEVDLQRFPDPLGRLLFEVESYRQLE